MSSREPPKMRSAVLMPHFLKAPHACHSCTTVVSGRSGTQLTTLDASLRNTHWAVASFFTKTMQFR